MIETERIGYPLILASKSPRRKEILSSLGLSFQVADSGIADEQSYIDPENLEHSLCQLASAKANSVAHMNPRALVLGADTIVVINNRILGKPSDEIEGFKMLQALSANHHEVITAVSVVCRGEHFELTKATKTVVYFRDLSDQEIKAYLKTGEYKDKAGAYAIQGKAMAFVDRIEGCYYNVVGLPVTATLHLIKQFIVRKESVDVRQKRIR
ncbi:Maf family protein [Chitinispirillales bacterium ANBcel5]|uniref:Maf family protein n=1 Tax=Cellulosispirillum alkaliphilum TaxID=3039283 RepID=UPI002A4E9151|nr:Maf family protein [Chitinispirillales bacterium ANBcel5]